jgi:hypothetical protein
MIDKSPRHPRCAPALAALGLFAGAACAHAAPADDGRWHFNLVPYLWLPAVSGSVDTVVGGLPGVDGRTARPVDVSGTINPDSYLSNLKMALMLIGEAHQGRWLIYSDLIYTNLGSQATSVRRVTGPRGNLSGQIARNATTDMSSTIVTLGGGYAVVDTAGWELHLVAGARFFDLSSDLTLSLQDGQGRYLFARKASMDRQVWDGIVGVRGEVRFAGGNWFVPYYADVGAGTSSWTWQALLGLGYRFDWGAVTLAWRALAYDFTRNDAKLTLSGPGLGVSIRW